jgi:hypothetical protein
MEFIIGLVVFLVALLIVSEGRSQEVAFTLRRRHLESLARLDDQVRVSLPPVAAELVAAAINEEMDGVA